MKLLYILNVANKVNNFSEASMLAALGLGWDFHIAGNWGYKSELELKADEKKYGIKIHQVDFIRMPLDFRNIKAFEQIIKIIKAEDIDMIHCNTPVGGVAGRIAGKLCGVNKVIYQAHGFHFWRNAPMINWMIYYPVERILAHKTDALITINAEDYGYAKKMNLRNKGKIFHVHGVGTSIDRFVKPTQERTVIRQTLGLSNQDIMLLAVGDFSRGKNHMFVMQAMQNLPDYYKFYICGDGKLRNEYERFISNNGLGARVKLLGYRSDIPDILNAADLFVMPSIMEGLPRAIMEAMAAKVPVICSHNKGHLELIKNDNCIFKYNSVKEFKFCISYALANKERIVEDNYSHLQKFTLSRVINELTSIYREMEANN